MKKPVHIKKEIRVVGLRRTGNHAIVNWIINQQKGKKLFINDTPPLASPYRNNYQPPDDGYLDALIYSHEDHRLNYVGNSYFEKRHDTFVGKSEKRIDVLILRDPFNLFASRMHSDINDMIKTYACSLSAPDMWILYAYEYLGYSNYLKNNKIIINYNQWFIDQEYRKILAEKLGLDFTDEGFGKVANIGKGSSFDGTKYDGNAHEMKVLERWKSYTNNDTYIKMFRDKIVVELSDKIFGRYYELDSLINNRIAPNYSNIATFRRKLIELLIDPIEFFTLMRLRFRKKHAIKINL